MDIGHHRRKWKSPILGVASWRFFTSIFLAYASIFLAYVEPNLFFCFRAGKFSSAAPSIASGTFTFVSGFACHGMCSLLSTVINFVHLPFWRHIEVLAYQRKNMGHERRMRPGERETTVIQPHYGPCISTLWRMNPRQSELANNARSLQKYENRKSPHYLSDTVPILEVSWAVCWHKIRMKVKSHNEEVKEIRDNNEIMRLKWMKSDLECRSKRMCIHVGFYVIQYIQLCGVRWWTSPPQMDLSPCTSQEGLRQVYDGIVCTHFYW